MHLNVYPYFMNECRKWFIITENINQNVNKRNVPASEEYRCAYWNGTDLVLNSLNKITAKLKLAYTGRYKLLREFKIKLTFGNEGRKEINLIATDLAAL